MFNTYTFPTKHVTEHVHEHRAATDESVRLLHELEKEAANKVLSVNQIQNNFLKAHWTVIDDPIKMELTAVCRFAINGKEIRFETVIERPFHSQNAARKVIRGVIDRLSEELVRQLLMTPLLISKSVLNTPALDSKK